MDGDRECESEMCLSMDPGRGDFPALRHFKYPQMKLDVVDPPGRVRLNISEYNPPIEAHMTQRSAW